MDHRPENEFPHVMHDWQRTVFHDERLKRAAELLGHYWEGDEQDPGEAEDQPGCTTAPTSGIGPQQVIDQGPGNLAPRTIVAVEHDRMLRQIRQLPAVIDDDPAGMDRRFEFGGDA